MPTDQPSRWTHAAPPAIPYNGATVGHANEPHPCRCAANTDHVIGATVTASGRNGPRRQNLSALAARRRARGKLAVNCTKS
ncbi:hypothetical protein GCM10010170_025870 [Dactylosporangium salmoneum]|uniref:Uncharacterized protein n=1 Tax=Dactylosporangium salmoneum TaxID=53361 RepID=A0ABN3G183_9ACTN